MRNPGRTIIVIIILNACILLMTKLFFLDIIVVRGHSMEPSLVEGTPVLINKMTYGLREPFSGSYLVRWREPQREEVVVFRSPLDGTTAVKRCVAVAGDSITIFQDKLQVNNLSIPLKFFQEDLLTAHPEVPADHILVIGDNYTVSTDSRTFGFVPLVDVVGAVCFTPARNKAVL